MKNVLIISYFFPPLGGPGVQRISKFVKYLPRTGWNPLVLTVKEIEYIAHDQTLLEEIKTTEIHATESIDPMRLLHLWEKYVIRNRSQLMYRSSSATQRSFWRDLFPIDSKIGWIPFAVKKGIHLCRTQRIDLIFATIGPYSSSLVAKQIAQRCSLPYVLDYRDLWQGKPDISYATRYHYQFSKKCEWKSLKSAAHVIVNTNSAREKLHSIYPQLEKSKTSVLYNGYDKADFLNPPKKQNRKTIFAYTGGFYGKRTPFFFLQALRELSSEKKIMDSVQFQFVGNLVHSIQNQFQTFQPDNLISLIPQVDHQTCINYLIQADFLLLFIAKNDSEIVIPAKLFEYFAAKKPILAMIPPKGEAAELIRKHQAGLICEMDDVKQIKSNILRFIREKKDNNLRYYNQLPDYERSQQTQQLAQIFNDHRKN